jgi:hypothetical protein
MYLVDPASRIARNRIAGVATGAGQCFSPSVRSLFAFVLRPVKLPCARFAELPCSPAELGTHSASSTIGQECPEWHLANSQVHRPQQSRCESSWTSSKRQDIPTSAMPVGQWDLLSARLLGSSHGMRRRSSSTSYWMRNRSGALPPQRQRGGNPPSSKCSVLCRRKSLPGSFAVVDGLPSRPKPRTGTRLAFCSIAKRLVNGHGSHMKATGNPWGVSSWRSCVFYLKILVPGSILILDHSDVSRGRF